MLTNAKIDKIKPEKKTKRYLDYDSLYLVVDSKSKKHPKGRKYWLCRIEFQGKEYKRVFGEYENITLEEARDFRRDFKTTVRQGLSIIDNDITLSFSAN